MGLDELRDSVAGLVLKEGQAALLCCSFAGGDVGWVAE